MVRIRKKRSDRHILLVFRSTPEKAREWLLQGVKVGWIGSMEALKKIELERPGIIYSEAYLICGVNSPGSFEFEELI